MAREPADVRGSGERGRLARRENIQGRPFQSVFVENGERGEGGPLATLRNVQIIQKKKSAKYGQKHNRREKGKEHKK